MPGQFVLLCTGHMPQAPLAPLPACHARVGAAALFEHGPHLQAFLSAPPLAVQAAAVPHIAGGIYCPLHACYGPPAPGAGDRQFLGQARVSGTAGHVCLGDLLRVHGGQAHD